MPRKDSNKINSRQKGARGEREWAKYCTDRGYPAERGRQFSGSADSPDIRSESLSRLHFEVKRVERLLLYAAIAQAVRDVGSASKVPTVAHRTNGGEWLITLRASDFFDYFIPGFLERFADGKDKLGTKQ